MKPQVEIRKPRKNPATGEWSIPVYVDGVRSEDRTYYTDDREDAFGTYRAMLLESNE